MCVNPHSNHITALISPNARSLAELAERLNKPGHSIEELCKDPEVVEHVRVSMKHAAQRLGFKSKEIPVEITLVKDEWSADNNLLTAALKLRRKAVTDFYKKEIETMQEKVRQRFGH